MVNSEAMQSYVFDAEGFPQLSTVAESKMDVCCHKPQESGEQTTGAIGEGKSINHEKWENNCDSYYKLKNSGNSLECLENCTSEHNKFSSRVTKMSCEPNKIHKLSAEKLHYHFPPYKLVSSQPENFTTKHFKIDFPVTTSNQVLATTKNNALPTTKYKISQIYVSTSFKKSNSFHCCKGMCKSLEGASSRASKVDTKFEKRKRKRRISQTFKRLTVDIWEEFYYGISILDEKRDLPNLNSLTSYIFETFRGVVPKNIIEVFVLTCFFVIFFLSCMVYNMFWQLLGFIFLHEHLSLHELAYTKNIKLKFTGSVFQGPGYAYIRQVWCAHCAQQSCEKISLNLMKTYREDYQEMKKVNNN